MIAHNGPHEPPTLGTKMASHGLPLAENTRIEASGGVATAQIATPDATFPTFDVRGHRPPISNRRQLLMYLTYLPSVGGLLINQRLIVIDSLCFLPIARGYPVSRVSFYPPEAVDSVHTVDLINPRKTLRTQPTNSYGMTIEYYRTVG